MGMMRDAMVAGVALRARRARGRGDAEGVRRAVMRVLRSPGAGPGDASAVALRDCLPIMQSRGGFFSCIAVTEGGARSFVKCVPRRSVEVRFWEMFANGGIVGAGAHFHVTPPLAVRVAGRLAVLIFAEDPRLATPRPRRQRHFVRRTRDVIRAIAEFNAANMSGGGGAIMRAGAHRVRSVPQPRKVARLLGMPSDEARDITRRLREIDRGWRSVQARLEDMPHCLGHLDLGPGNIALGADVAEIHDFGYAAMAPVGADLHTVLRFARSFDREEMVRVYLEVFADKGITLDAGAVRFAAEAHFAARYRNPSLPSARRREVVEEALDTSGALIARVCGQVPGQ